MGLNGQANIYDFPIDVRQRLRGLGGRSAASSDAVVPNQTIFIYDIEVEIKYLWNEYYVILDENSFENNDAFVSFSNEMFEKIVKYYTDEYEEEVAYISEFTTINCKFATLPSITNNKNIKVNLLLTKYDINNNNAIEIEEKFLIYHNHNKQNCDFEILYLLDKQQNRKFVLHTKNYDKKDDAYPVLHFDLVECTLADLLIKVELDTATGKLSLTELKNLASIYFNNVGSKIEDRFPVTFLIQNAGEEDNITPIGFSYYSLSDTLLNASLEVINDNLKVENIIKENSVIQCYFSSEILKIDTLIPPEITSDDNSIKILKNWSENKVDLSVILGDLEVILTSVDNSVKIKSILDLNNVPIKNAFDLSSPCDNSGGITLVSADGSVTITPINNGFDLSSPCNSGGLQDQIDELSNLLTGLKDELEGLKEDKDDLKDELEGELNNAINQVNNTINNITQNITNIEERIGDVFNLVMSECSCEKFLNCFSDPAFAQVVATKILPYLPNTGGN